MACGYLYDQLPLAIRRCLLLMDSHRLTCDIVLGQLGVVCGGALWRADGGHLLANRKLEQEYKVWVGLGKSSAALSAQVHGISSLLWHGLQYLRKRYPKRFTCCTEMEKRCEIVCRCSSIGF